MSKNNGSIVIEPQQGAVIVKVKAGDRDAGYAKCTTWSQARAVATAMVESLFFELIEQQRARKEAERAAAGD